MVLMSGGSCADVPTVDAPYSPAVSAPHRAASKQVLRADITLVLVLGGVVDAGLEEGVVALAAFAAQAAMPESRIPTPAPRVHARQRQFERDAERAAAHDHLRLARARVRGVDLQIVREPQRERTRHRGPELRRRIGNGIV